MLRALAGQQSKIPFFTRAASSAAASRAFVAEPTPITHPDESADTANSAALEQLNKYILPTYARPNLIFTHGKGSHVYDTQGRKYLDFTAGIAVNALGHSDPETTQVLAEQAAKAIHLSNLYHNEHSGPLAELLVTATQEGGWKDAARCFFANSGTEANEGALKFARKWGKLNGSASKHQILSFKNSFHGRSMGALSVTANKKYQEPFSPLIPGITHSDYNDIASLNTSITDETCAVIVEPIQGEGGVFVANEEFLAALRKRCDEVGALLIYDEIQCGLGRTGKVWAHGHYSNATRPDILTMAKPLANGVPIGAVMMTERVADIVKVGDHGTTFGGNPLACAVAHSVFSRISKPAFLSQVQETSHTLVGYLEELKALHPESIQEIRGKGMLLGVGFTRDPSPIVKAARERGLLVVSAGNNTVRIIPPLILTQDEAQRGVEILHSSILAVEQAQV
ncbi:hypothetical protein BZG36_04178 [Bifiguratus adelaidae]|uniref:acetylornithine transaminase n=1 Tax=Bifiguratus adelaidae TaxID=1938954 RepID=A0A261XYU3_9FUNG|nr:hypothetical protein BZG36_04178 [Bifiguratus adelaidae]